MPKRTKERQVAVVKAGLELSRLLEDWQARYGLSSEEVNEILQAQAAMRKRVEELKAK